MCCRMCSLPLARPLGPHTLGCIAGQLGVSPGGGGLRGSAHHRYDLGDVVTGVWVRGRVLCVSERDEILKGISQCVVPADRGAAGRDTTVASPVKIGRAHV